ncbi:hypothetical protein B0O80DRAFT_454891 [Mortierella sp. GBAus27b]|nr:hypothetical protein BGX31_002437 [Mortierella sp. GBA43]KAI8351859.1 hypothetical protein B0O80DRAFT_454891 [Mortierella sp. GBAus27b]
MDKTNPLHIPEVVALVGSHIKMWYSIGHDRYGFKPQDMHSCIQVSRLFRDTLLPILWHTFDERAALDIPTYLIEKNMPLIRIYFNYGFREDVYPASCRLLSTHLVWLNITYQYNDLYPLRPCDVVFISKNSNLKRLEGVVHDEASNEVISSLRHLEHLHLPVVFQSQPVQPTLQHISKTLKVLHLEYGVPDLPGMVLPKLREFEVEGLDNGDTLDFLSRCPSLESVKCWCPCLELLTRLKGGELPGIKKLGLRALPEQNQALAEMLESRTGFQELNLNMEQGSDRLSNAICRHSSTLTHLTLDMGELCMRSVFNILSSCGRLQNVSLNYIERDLMERVLWKTHWKNPGMLKVLNLSSYQPENESLSQRYDREMDQDDRLIRPTLLKGWIIPTGEPIARSDQQFFGTLFMAAQGFARLGTITIDYITYTKAFH